MRVLRYENENENEKGREAKSAKYLVLLVDSDSVGLLLKSVN